MRVLAITALLLIASPAAADHPIEGVINLLKGLTEKVENEGKSEAVAFTKYEYFCKNTLKTLNAAIEGEKAQIDSLTDSVAGLKKQEETLTEQIAGLEKKLGEYEATATKAKDLRDEGAALYETTVADYASTITAVDDAIKALEGAKTDTSLLVRRQVKTAVSLVETLITDEQRQVFTSFLEEEPLKAEGDRQTHVKKYTFKSGNVVELLKQLKAMFEEEKLAAEKAETNSLNEFALSKQARDAAVTAATDSKSQKEEELGGVEADRIADEEKLTGVEGDLEADTKSRDDTETSCKTKKSEWDERSQVRQQELEAMAAAIKILAKVGGVRTEAPSNPVPPPSPADAEFAQLGLSLLEVVDPKTKAINLLKATAHKTHSKALETLAKQLAMAGPFDEVLNMVQKMIFRLMGEQKDEDDHKNWCDLEVEKSDKSKADKEDKISELETKIEDGVATVQQLAEEIDDANDMVAKLTGFMKEATEIRETGKQENAEAIKDASDAQTAIAQAVAVLEQFYKESGKVPKEEWEFIQRGVVEVGEAPSTWDSSYSGTSDPMNQPDGIIAVLEATSSDFAKMEADTKAQEAIDQKEFQAGQKESDIEKSRRAKEADLKSQQKKRLQDKINSMTKAKKHTSDELEAVEQYIKDLQPACVDGDSTYEDRKAARTEEIDALKQAQKLLAEAFKEPSPSFLQNRRA